MAGPVARLMAVSWNSRFSPQGAGAASWERGFSLLGGPGARRYRRRAAGSPWWRSLTTSAGLPSGLPTGVDLSRLSFRAGAVESEIRLLTVASGSLPAKWDFPGGFLPTLMFCYFVVICVCV